jgi:hypothetical protein
MEQVTFEQAILTVLRQVPERQRGTILNTVQTLVRELKMSQPDAGRPQYSVEQHRALRRLTTTIDGNLAAAVSAERDERG